MKYVNEIPKSGMFVAVWENGNGIWANTFLVDDGVLKYFQSESDTFIEYEEENKHLLGNAVFIVK